MLFEFIVPYQIFWESILRGIAFIVRITHYVLKTVVEGIIIFGMTNVCRQRDLNEGEAEFMQGNGRSCQRSELAKIYYDKSMECGRSNDEVDSAGA